MKRILFIAIIVLRVIGLFGQSGAEMHKYTGAHPATAKEAADRLNAVVGLSPSQYQRVISLSEQLDSATRAMRAVEIQNKRSYPDFVLANPAKELTKKADEQLKAILTAEQWQKVLDRRAMHITSDGR
jgi:hypothetical protein